MTESSPKQKTLVKPVISNLPESTFKSKVAAGKVPRIVPSNKSPKATAFWDTVFNSVGEAISIVNVENYTIAEVNNVFLQEYGVSREQVIGRTCYSVSHHETSPCRGPEHSCPLLEAVKTGQIAAVEHVHFARDGKQISFEVSAAPIRNEDGNIKQVVHVARDITEKKLAQHQLIMNDRLATIGMLASGIAHEVGNPLTSIMGYAHTLPLMAELPAEIKDGLKVIQEESQRAAEILHNLLTFARPEPGKTGPVNVNESISRVLKLRSFHQKRSQIDTSLSLDSDLPPVTGNRAQLEQVFYNIIANAEYSMTQAHNSGNLLITTKREGPVVRAVFTDDGLGISEIDLTKIFAPFFTTKKSGQGTGLGLSICSSIVNEHGGRLWAESSLGKGATFIVELPVNKENGRL